MTAWSQKGSYKRFLKSEKIILVDAQMLRLPVTPIVLFISVNIVLRYLSKFNLEAVVGRCSSKQVFLVFFFFFQISLENI